MEHVAWDNLNEIERAQLAKFYPQLSQENKEEEDECN